MYFSEFLYFSTCSKLKEHTYIDIMINNCKLIKNGKIYLPAAFQ